VLASGVGRLLHVGGSVHSSGGSLVVASLRVAFDGCAVVEDDEDEDVVRCRLLDIRASLCKSLMARLPAELTDIIIDLVSDHRDVLCACSRVCKDWLPASRRGLFSTVLLTNSSKRTRALIKLLTLPSSTIAKYAHTLAFLNHSGYPIQPLSTIAQPLEKLVGVNTLILQGRWDPVQESDIRRLSIWFANITTLDIQPWLQIYPSPNQFSAFLSLFSSLTVLRIRTVCRVVGEGDADDNTLSLPPSLRAIHLRSRLDFAWLIPFLERSAVSELWLSQAGIVDLHWLQRLLHSCGPSLQLLDLRFPFRNTGEPLIVRTCPLLSFTPPGSDVVRILHEHLDLSCLSHLQVLRIGTLRHWFHQPDSGEYLSELVSRITSEHMTHITLRLQCFVSGVDAVLELINWMRLARTLSHPRFARLRRVEIVLEMLNARWPESEVDEWVSRLRSEMSVLDSRGCLFVSILYHYGIGIDQ
jgi:hypothetical protein